MKKEKKIEVFYLKENDSYFGQIYIDNIHGTSFWLKRRDLQGFIFERLQAGYKIEFPNNLNN